MERGCGEAENMASVCGTVLAWSSLAQRAWRWLPWASRLAHEHTGWGVILPVPDGFGM